MSLSKSKLTEASSDILKAYESGIAIAPLRNALDMTIADAYAIQEENTKHWLSEGRHLSGRKIGVTSKAVQQQLGVDQPDYGMLFSDMAYTDTEEVPFGRLVQPRIEGEIGFYLGKDLTDPRITVAEVMSAIEYAVAAFEIVDSRISDWDISITDTIADNASSGLYVLSTARKKLSEFDHRLCGMVVEHRGEPVSVGAGAACLGNPLNACLWLARKMIEVGRPLKEGDLILSGALGPMVPVEAGESYELRIDGLGSCQANFSL